MDWKKTGVVLVTLGVTASVCYVSYSFIFKANLKGFEAFKSESESNGFFSTLTEENVFKMKKNIGNITKRQLFRFTELFNKNVLLELEEQDFNKIKIKWNYE